MRERDVLYALTARADNYEVSSLTLLSGHLYSLTMKGEQHRAVMLIHSFQYYEKQYHITQKQKPTLIVCFVHDTVVPIPVLSMRAGKLAKAYELPEEIADITTQRWSKLGSQVLLGMYISGVKKAQTIVKKLPASTRNRYLQKVEDLGRRKRGRPLGIPSKRRKGNQP